MTDERRQAPGGDPWWCEAWDFDFATPDASLGGYVRLDLLPNQRVCWYAAALVGQGRDPVVVVDHEIGLPRPPGLEIRAEGLWADHIVEDPLDHVSVGCEAFALRLDGASDALAVPLLGERTPFGLDLGWETETAAVTTAGGYALGCRVVGEILVADERIALDACGWRRHLWGASGPASRLVPRATTRGRVADGTWVYDDDPGWLERHEHQVVADAPMLTPGRQPRAVRRDLCRLVDPTADCGGVAWSDRAE